jgi:hypothetical protein
VNVVGDLDGLGLAPSGGGVASELVAQLEEWAVGKLNPEYIRGSRRPGGMQAADVLRAGFGH